MLCTFPKAFPQGQHPNDSFLNGNFQMCNFPSGNFPKVRPSEAPQATMGAERCGKDGLGGQAPRLEQAGLPSAAARTDLGSCRLGSCLLGKFPWEVATWEKSFGKVSNKRYFIPRRSPLKKKKIRDQLINLDEMR